MEIIARALYWISQIIFWGTIAFAGLFFLRVLLNWVGANPFGRVPYYLTRITEPMVRPIRYQFGRVPTMRFDLIPLVMGVMILVTGLFLSSVIWQLAVILINLDGILRLGGAARPLIGELVRLIGLLYVVAIFLRFFLPFFGVGYSNKLFRFIFVITEPLLKPLRRFFVMGMFDFSPIIAMLIVQLLTGFIANAIGRGGM